LGPASRGREGEAGRETRRERREGEEKKNVYRQPTYFGLKVSVAIAMVRQ